MWIKGVLLFVIFLTVVNGSFFEVHYPNVDIFSEAKGNVTVEAGPEGNVIIQPGHGGKVFIGNTEFAELATIILSLPPIWSQSLGDGRLGTFKAGRSISVSVVAEDPERGTITYQRISGAFPPNVVIDPNTGRIHGQAPDVDALYTFGIRATDNHGKYADTVFTMEIREINQCDTKPCLNGGVCTDLIDAFICRCQSGIGGKTCSDKCVSTALGVAANVRKIPDAQMSAHYSYSQSSASEGRLGHAKGWIGTAAGAWLQVDLGHLTDLYAISMQSSTGGFLTLTYNIATSINGATFVNIMNGTAPVVFAGTATTGTVSHVLDSHVRARYVRVIPVTFSSKPGLRVELYGCTVAN